MGLCVRQPSKFLMIARLSHHCGVKLGEARLVLDELKEYERGLKKHSFHRKAIYMSLTVPHVRLHALSGLSGSRSLEPIKIPHAGERRNGAGAVTMAKIKSARFGEG